MRKVSRVRVQNSDRFRRASSSGDSVSVSGGLYTFGNHFDDNCKDVGIRHTNSSRREAKRIFDSSHLRKSDLQILKGCIAWHLLILTPKSWGIVVGHVTTIGFILSLLRGQVVTCHFDSAPRGPPVRQIPLDMLWYKGWGAVKMTEICGHVVIPCATNLPGMPKKWVISTYRLGLRIHG